MSSDTCRATLVQPQNANFQVLVKKATSADLVKRDLIICPALLCLLLLLLLCSLAMSVDARITFLLVSTAGPILLERLPSRRDKQARELSVVDSGPVFRQLRGLGCSLVLDGAPQPQVAATPHQITTCQVRSEIFLSCLLIKLTYGSLRN